VRERARELGKHTEGQYAEAFRIITLESDEDWEKFKGQVEGVKRK
jgi:hypothetical protein